MKISRQKGTKDIVFEDALIWEYLEKKIRKIAYSYNVNEIRTPVFEATELYARSVGDETDIVNKEMYTFKDKGDRSITLRPELTAGVVRAYIENGFESLPSPLKFWYVGNMYRYEKMQKGRYREFAQFGVEIFGSSSYHADVETICLSHSLFKEIGLWDKLQLNINSIGCKECRAKYIEKLKEYVKPNLENMCQTCNVRYEKNPLRMLDCKEERCKEILQNAPMITDNLCDECKKDFENLKKALDDFGIDYVVDKKIVRGLDYYNKTVYEYTSKDLGLAVGGGGRYDGLVEMLGGKSTPAVGFGIGMDRLVLLLKEYNLVEDIINKNYVDVYFLILDENGYSYASDVITKIRELGYKVELDIQDKSFKSKLRYADKIKSKYVCIIGENEIKCGKCTLKNMNEGTQEDINFSIDEILKRME